ncbi:hypothetical protein [Actinacidiphila sp. ITFR-21]|uniref:hypothetical protein n=1 Tax=Actinacidiphila sp. ITFR-21 TaxID=3075199 RepID=UPI00288AA64B|nr:hypothetical protein [Streptomyces sp. ITFR-21]WNI20315.1 hypothetical protein RLT57_33140 [Streptomyces sp. ITFR-21]
MTGDLILSAMCAAAVLLPATLIASRTAHDQDGEHDPRRCGDCKALGLPDAADAAQPRVPRQTRGGNQ